MKTEQTIMTNSEKGINEVLTATEKLGCDYGLDKKSVLHLRLLAEELFGLMRGIAGNTDAEYKIAAEDKKFELHLKSEVKMTDEMREKFLTASSSGKNAAAVGFTGKIRVFVANAMLSIKEMAPYAVMNTASAYTPGEASVWTMSEYRSEVLRAAAGSADAKNAWDELEKSVIAKIADDVKVSIVGKSVEIIIYKAF